MGPNQISEISLHASGTDQWTIQVPLGKLKTERMVP